MKKIIVVTCLIIRCTLSGMETGEDFYKIFKDNFRIRENNQDHNEVLANYVTDGQPKDLDENLMKLTLACCPNKVHNIIKGLKNSELNELYPHELIFTGPPGTGKTTLALAVAYALNLRYKLIETIQLSNEYKDSAAQNLWRVVMPIIKTQQPVVLVLDEITAITRDTIQEKTDGWKSAMSLWKLLDQLKKYPEIIVIGTTNDASEMPPQLKSRFSGAVIEVQKPSNSSRSQVISYYIQKYKALCNQTVLAAFVKETENVSIRDLETLTKQVIRTAWEKTNSKTIQESHITEAIQEWHYVTNTLLKINEPQLTLQERLHKENIEFNQKEGEKNRKQQQEMHDQDILLQEHITFWTLWDAYCRGPKGSKADHDWNWSPYFIAETAEYLTSEQREKIKKIYEEKFKNQGKKGGLEIIYDKIPYSKAFIYRFPKK